MKKFLKVTLISLAVVFSLSLILGAFSSISFLFYALLSGAFTDDHPTIERIFDPKGKGVPEKRIEDQSLEGVMTEKSGLSIKYDPVPEEIKNLEIDCENSKEIPKNLRKEKALCRNIYQTDGEKLRNEVQGKEEKRIVLYGQYIIQSCPIRSNTKIKNLVDGCYDTARFLDNYMYKKMATLLDVSIPKKRLFVYITESENEINAACHQKAWACFGQIENTLYLPLNKYTDHFYHPGGLDRSQRMGYESTEHKGVTYWYYPVEPKNCAMAPIELHEIIHYFNYLAYGTLNSYMEESATQVFTERIFSEVCPPGTVAVEVTKEKDGKTTPLDRLDFSSDEIVLINTEQYWRNDTCVRAAILVLNKGVREQGLQFYRVWARALNKSDEWRDIHRMIANSFSDPNEIKKMFKKGNCPY